MAENSISPFFDVEPDYLDFQSKKGLSQKLTKSLKYRGSGGGI